METLFPDVDSMAVSLDVDANEQDARKLEVPERACPDPSCAGRCRADMDPSATFAMIVSA